MTRPRIGFLLPHYSERSLSHMAEVLRRLAAAGAHVDVINPARRIVDLSEFRVEHDLYVLKKISGLAFSLAGALHVRGAAILNPYPASVALRDKIVAFRVLQAAGVPTPASYAASQVGELAPLLDAGPIIVKPYQGSGGYGVRVVRSAAELAELPGLEKPVFAQRYHPPDGRDLKLYVIGERVFGTFKVFPARTEAEKHGEPFTPSPEFCDIARQCGRAFGIDLYGVDIVESGGQPYVVDMSSMPGFKGIPDAPSLLAPYFYAAAERAARGEQLYNAPAGVRVAHPAAVS
jgi:ribosomal protein S6--L-glutamate ligase